MNKRMVFNTIGHIARIEALLLLFPALVSAIYREKCVWAFLITAVGAFVLGTLLNLICKTKNRVIYAKEGFVVVALSWITLSIIGSVPFTLSEEIPSYIDAFFETVSGFTTTGSSILTDVTALSHGTLFWRSFTHWIGGMGILMFVMAIIPNLSERSIHIMRAEVPGPVVGKLVPRVKDTAKILYLIYIFLTVLEIVMLYLGDMPLFDSMVYAFGTAGTGGFGIKPDSVGSYSSYCQWVITVFMLLFGVNFNLFYLLLLGKIRTALKSSELWTYITIFGVSTAIITINIMPLYSSFEKALRNAAFQVASITTTTGYATADFNQWGSISKSLIFVLLFTGACAGSTCGGLKLSRIMLLFKSVAREFRRMLHPRSVATVKLEGKAVDDTVTNSANVYFALYFICLFTIFLAISFEPFSFETNFTATVTCINNVGPGFDLVGPAGNFSIYSKFSKLVLSAAMLLGRLELFPMILAFSPSNWIKK